MPTFNAKPVSIFAANNRKYLFRKFPPVSRPKGRIPAIARTNNTVKNGDPKAARVE